MNGWKPLKKKPIRPYLLNRREGKKIMYIEKIQQPTDVKQLNLSELQVLKNEIRSALLAKLSTHGGHIGPNLGLVEVTIALHYVFDSPKDKIVYDVSHQSYVHKMLTGRMNAFLDSAHYDDVSGYSNPQESEHDIFTIGHTSTSISLSCGLAKARDLKGEDGNVIALIGDGSLSGGEAYEGLNNAAELGTNMIIVVNDNEMSIAENHGGLYQGLAQLRKHKGKSEFNFFRSLGLDYLYIEEGHDLETLIQSFTKIKDIDHPIVLHIHTQKGKGYVPAQQDKETWHWNSPFDLEKGMIEEAVEGEAYDTFTASYLLEEMKKDADVVAVTSGTPAVFGFHKKQRMQAGKQFVDVGIAEEHAVAFISGVAANGGKPVYGVYSTFLQRTYDQLSQDLCVNNNPALLLVFAASIFGMNDVTHLGIYDMAMIGNIPNLVYLAPTNFEEYEAMMTWGLHQKEHPVAIRVPVQPLTRTGKIDTTDYYQLNRYKVTRKGSKVALLGLGNFYALAEKTADILHDAYGVDVTLINPKFISGIDESLLADLKADHQLVITLEDGILEGGFGEKVARYYGMDAMKVKTYGFDKLFYDRYDAKQLMKQQGLEEEQLVSEILAFLHK